MQATRRADQGATVTTTHETKAARLMVSYRLRLEGQLSGLSDIDLAAAFKTRRDTIWLAGLDLDVYLIKGLSLGAGYSHRSRDSNISGVGYEEDLNRVLVLDPGAVLLPDTTYAIHVAGTLSSDGGRGLDQQPCTAGVQEFVASFRTIARPTPPPGDMKTHPAVARTRPPRP